MDTTIKQLVEKFNDGTATPAERDVLLMYIRSGQGIEILDEDLYNRIQRYFDNPGLLQISEAEEAAALPLFQKSQARLQELTQSAASSTPVVRLSWRWFAVAASVVIAAVVGWIAYQDPLTVNQGVVIATTTPAKTYTGRQLIHLPDGSTVLLNDNSLIRYDSVFGATSREVFLEGEAYFDIAHNPAKPFRVHTGHVDTYVLGTAFNVRAYPHQSDVVVTVTRGKVQVSDNKGHQDIITPDQQLTINTTQSHFQKTDVQAEQSLTWKTDFLILDNITIAEAAAKISEKYGVTVSVPDTTYRKCIIQTSFLHHEDLTQVLTILSALSNGSYTLSPHAPHHATISGSCH